MNFNTILIKIRFDWDRFGLKEKVTAANQLTDYVYDETGLLRAGRIPTVRSPANMMTLTGWSR